jgi:hypothetical protein
VADGGTNEIRFFGPDGRHVRTVGRTGAGPGEFVVISSVIRLPGDSLLVHDIRSRRLTIIGPDASVRREEVAPRILGGHVLGRLSDGHLVVLVRSGLRPVIGYTRDTVQVAIERERDGLDTLVVLPSTERVGQPANRPGGGSVARIHPFGYEAQAAVWGDDVVVGTSESWELHLIGTTGRPRAILRRTDAPPRSLEGEPLEAYLQSVTSAGWSAAASLEIMKSFPGPRYIPAYSAVHADDAGCLWVRDFSVADPAGKAVASRWTVFTRSGQIVARATLPAGFELFHIARSSIVGRVRDAYDVEYIQVHQLERRGSPRC